MTLSDYLIISQIIFLSGTLLIAFLTYRSAKKGILNSVNTEYQKVVIQTLKELSDYLFNEFNIDSEKYWAKKNTTKEIVEKINNKFLIRKEDILKTGEFRSGIPLSIELRTLTNFVNKVKSDPFIPADIRELLIDLLENRADISTNIHLEILESYQLDLAKGKHLTKLDNNWAWISNQINDKLYEQGCGISQIEIEIHKIRLAIQKHFEKYNPMK